MSWEEIIGDLRFWTIVFIILGIIISLKIGGIKILGNHPRYDIKYKRSLRPPKTLTSEGKQKRKQANFLTLKRIDGKKIQNCKLYYATQRNAKFKKVSLSDFNKERLIEEDISSIPHNELGLNFNHDKPIIWKFVYRSPPFWFVSCEIFEWDNTNFKSGNWNEYYALGKWAIILQIGKIRRKENKQLKRWRKLIKKAKKEDKKLGIISGDKAK